MALVARNLALVSLVLVLALMTFRSSAEPKEVFPFALSSRMLRSDDLDSDWTDWKKNLLLGGGAIQPSAVVHAPSGLALNRLLRRVFEKPYSSSSAARAPSTATTFEEIPPMQGMKKRTAPLDDIRYLASEVSSRLLYIRVV